MARKPVREYLKIMSRADKYHKQALWQEKLRSLQEAQAICEVPGFPDAAARRQDLLLDLGAIRRRMGQYSMAESLLKQALHALPSTGRLKRASILGELSTVLRHSNKFLEAREASQQQYSLAFHLPPTLERDVALCHAIGTEGMLTYNMSRKQDVRDPCQLSAASAQLRERIKRARDLQERIRTEAPHSTYARQSRIWEAVGMNRFSLCLIAADETAEAVRVAEAAQSLQVGGSPTVTAYSNFFYGNALWSDGQCDDALHQWNAPNGTCSSPIACCQEPSEEHTE